MRFSSIGRKRNPKVRARRRRSPRRSFLAFSSAFLLIALCVAGAYKWLRPRAARRQAPQSAAARSAAPTLTPAERRAISTRIALEIERVGGDDVWIKPDRAAPDSNGWGPDPRVVVLPRAFNAVIAAIRRQASADGLKMSFEEMGAPDAGALRSLELALFSPGASGSSGIVARWRVLEVPRLYRAAIIIDDLGQEIAPPREILALPYPLTLSILPGLPHSIETAEEAHRLHREVMLHLPMEAEKGRASVAPPAGAGEIRVGMPPGEVAEVIERDLASVPYARGVNNHQGSRATADAALMAEVMRALGARRLYFVDSRTSPSTVALEAARHQGLPAFYRSVFLDDTETVAYTLGQLDRFRRVVERQGVALAIGHPHPSTLRALAQFLPQLDRDNIELVPASRLVRLPEVAKLSPPAGKGVESRQ